MPSSKRLRTRLPVIGVTGGVGAGKSAVASLFQSWGGVLISGDDIGKEVVDRSSRLRGRLAEAFGADILKGQNLRRPLLARRAFASLAATQRLNDLVHPALLKELNRQIEKAMRSTRHCAVVVDAALLPEWGKAHVPWDYLVGVWAPRQSRYQRLKKRGWSDGDIRARIRGQMPWGKRRQVIDYVVKNDGSMTLLERRARFCWKKIVSSPR